MPRIRNERNDSTDQLFRSILALRDVDECYRFFGDLLTVQELSAFAQRLQDDFGTAEKTGINNQTPGTNDVPGVCDAISRIYRARPQ